MDAYGALIERGVILSAEADGYRVESFARDGVITPPIPAINDTEYTVGDRVYFFLFDDGRGSVLMDIK